MDRCRPYLFIALFLIVLCSCEQAEQSSQGQNFIEHINQNNSAIGDSRDQLQFFQQPPHPVSPKFQHFPTGSISPKGWIKEMMKTDLENGIVGALERLYPGIQSDDLYHTARRGGMEDIPEMGDLVLTGAEWEKSILWWNAETIGNWWDGFIRHAFLTQNLEAIQKSHQIINNLLASQDADGYIGIYKSNMRYQHEGTNGELWAQTTAFRAMLAYYEFTKNQKVLDAVEKAMALTMSSYSDEGKNPFQLKNAFGGVTHGLMMTDVCETLFRITKKQAYQEYANYLYKAFSSYSINRAFNDLRYPYLIEEDSLFEGHAAHSYEHIRSMANAYFNTGYPELKRAYKAMLAKLEPCLLPSGAGHGNEWIAKLKAHPDHTGSEYCAMLELRNSYGSLMQKTGKVEFADRAEQLTYNAMLGSRNKTGTAITYGKTDNCYVLDGKHHEDGESREDPRYKYSPTHSEPAVCCVPNYGRNLPYFLDQKWMKAEDGLALMMYGPSELRFGLDGEILSIEQVTDYPLSDKVELRFKMDQPKEFTLYLRRPLWSAGMEANIPLGEAQEGFYAVTKEWQDGDRLLLHFNNELQVKPAGNGEQYLQRGPLVYAYEIPHREEVIKTYSDKKYKDYYCYAIAEDYKDLLLPDQVEFVYNVQQVANSFYESEVFLEGSFYNKREQKERRLKLVPMGKTVLRKITFTQKQ